MINVKFLPNKQIYLRNMLFTFFAYNLKKRNSNKKEKTYRIIFLFAKKNVKMELLKTLNK
jgi:hypothetical protein